MSSKKLKFGNVVLCEHVVPGPNNKVTLINLFAGDINVAEFPARIMLGFYAEHIAEEDFSERLITITIHLYGKEYARIEVNVKNAQAGRPSIIMVPVFEAGLDGDTHIDAYATADGYGRSRIMRKKISLAPIS